MERIKELRLNKGLKQEELATILGVERSTVTKWETGDSKPRADILPKLAGVLGCSIDTLFLPKSVN